MEDGDYTETTSLSDIEYYFSPTVLAEEKRQRDKLERERLEEQFKKPSKMEMQMRRKRFKEDFVNSFVKCKEVLKPSN